MIKKFTPILWIVLVQFSTQILWAQNNDDSHYYYYQGEKIYLNIDRSYISINTTDSDSLFLDGYASFIDSKSEFIDFNDRGYLLPTDSIASSRIHLKNFHSKLELNDETRNNLTSYSDLLKQLEEEESVLKVSPCFTTQAGDRVGLTNNFLVRLKNKYDENLLYNFAEIHNLEVLGKEPYSGAWYMISCTKSNQKNALEYANLFHESNLFSNSEAEFTFSNSFDSDDTYYTDQWGIDNTGQWGEGYAGNDMNINEAWAISYGDGVNVAILDQGFEMDHPDLSGNVPGDGYDATTGLLHSIVYGRHGTPCAGIVGAVNGNGIGIAGVAPNSNLVSISMESTILARIRAFDWASQNNIDVLNYSGHSNIESVELENSIENALTNGRNGKGMVVVISTGNDNGEVRFPANSNDKIISVGAIDVTINKAASSNFGNELDIVAPGGDNIATTDRQGNSGQNIDVTPNDYDNKDYTARFGGTSAAAPYVAGVAALVLSENPELTNIQVNDIIESTAQKVGDYVYSVSGNRPNGDWNNEMGYGFVDAHQAVIAASLMPTASAGSDYSFCETGEEFNLIAENIDENETFYWQYPDGTNAPDNVNITLTLNASSSGIYTLYYFNENYSGPYSDQMSLTVINENTDLELVQLHPCSGVENEIIAELDEDLSYLWSSNWSGFVNPGDTDIYAFESETPFVVSLTATHNECNVEITGSITIGFIDEYFELIMEAVNPMCPGESVEIGIVNDEAYTYNWISNDNIDFNDEENTTSSINVSPTTTTTYQLTATGVSCASEIPADITVEIINETINIDLGSEGQICLGESITIGVPPIEGYTYNWYSNGGPAFANESLIPITTSGNYVLIASGTGSCGIIQGGAHIYINVLDETLPIDLGEDQTLCYGESIILNDMEASEDHSYQWFTIETGDDPIHFDNSYEIIVEESIEYSLIVNGEHCENVGFGDNEIMVNVLDETVTVDVGEDQTICNGESVTLEVNLSADDYDFEWTNYMNQTLSTTNFLTTIPNYSTTYTLSLSTDNCASVAVGNTSAIITLEDNTCNCGEYYHHTYRNVSETQTWSLDGFLMPSFTEVVAPPGVLRIENTLRILAGVTLTLSPDVTLEFGANGRITVEQGAELIVNGATITKACEDPWNGIEVFGDDELNQYGINQGKVVLKEEARIEYAKMGVSLIGHNEDYSEYWGTAGGILITNEATFYNCLNAIQFVEYQNYNASDEPTYNLSSLKNTQFIVDDALNDVFDGGNLTQISMWRVQGIRLRNCDFENQITSTNPDEFNKFEGVGLSAVNASFKLIANPTTLMIPTSESQYERSSISGFLAGVAVNNSDELGAIRINRTDFSDNYLGAFINNSNYSTITRNTFAVPENETWAGIVGYASSYGLALDHSTFYTVEENVFTGIENPSTNTAGLSIHTSGYLDNEIYRNEFNDLVYGTMVYGVNGYNNLYVLGLDLKCNDYGVENLTSDNNNTDIYLHTYAVIDAVQGMPGDQQSPAGNRFSNNPGNLLDGNIAIRNPEFNIQAYFHHTEQFTRPDYSLDEKVNKVPTPFDFGDNRNIPCPSNLSYGPIKHQEENKGLIVEKRLSLELLEDQYKNILNGGIKPEIMELLVDDFASSSAIRQKLILGSPYLSDDVLIAAITRQIPLNQWHLTEVLVWNGPLTKRVIKAFYQAQPLTPYLASLVLNKDGNSQRLLLELAQKGLSEEIVALEKDYLFTAFNDESIENPYTLAYYLYEDQNTPEAMRIKISALVQQQHYQEAYNLINDYAQEITDNYASFKLIELDLEQSGLNWFQMSSSQQNTLQQIAMQTEIYGAQNAQVILDLVNDNQLTEYILPIAEPLEMRQALSYNYTAVNRNLLSLSPNPTNGEVYASYELPENYKQAQLEIYNSMGQKVDVLDISSSKYLSRLNFEHYTSGIYLVSLVVDGMKIESQSLSVITK